MSQQCCARVYDGTRASFAGHMCSKKAKFHVGEKWYCSIHNPEAIERRRQKSDERYKEYRKQQDEQYARAAYDRKAGDVCRQLGLTDPKELLTGWHRVNTREGV